MNKKGFLQVGAIIIIILVIVTISYISGLTMAAQKEINLPSKCYTTLQSSHYFVKPGFSPVVTGKNYIKIEINDEFYTSHVSATGSMNPSIPDESIVIFVKPKIDEINVGDIIEVKCVNSYGSNLLHRVIRIENGIYYTKGDNNKLDDYVAFKCTPRFEDIKGKLVGVLF